MLFEVNEPSQVTADFVGEPGERTFYIQLTEAAETITVLVEKQQVKAVGDLLARLLGEAGVDVPQRWDVASMRLKEPLVARWRAGSVAVGHAPDLERFVIELTELLEEDEEREPERVRVWVTQEQAQKLAAHAIWSVEQGRPRCRLCGLPLDPEGHLCPRMNGDARPR